MNTWGKIFNVYGAHPDDIKHGTAGQDVFSIIPHLFIEFNNDPTVLVVYAGLNPGKNGANFSTVDSNAVREYLSDKVTPHTKLLFDNLYEGNFTFMINKIYQIIDGSNIMPSQVYYFSAALDASKLLTDYCIKHNKEKINVYSCLTWESEIVGTALRTNFNHRDIKYNIKKKNKKFLCFNRVTRDHRVALVSLLLHEDLIKDSYYSFFDNITHGGGVRLDYIFYELSRVLSEDVYKTIESTFYENRYRFPLELNIKGTNNKNYLDNSDLIYFDDSYFSLVTETYFFQRYRQNIIDEESVFFSEKIFKPILMKHPFLLVSVNSSLEYLRKIGYKTFHPFIDETYDTIENPEQRLLAITREVKRLSLFTDEQWIEWQENVKPIVEHNYNVISSRRRSDYAVVRSIAPKGI